MLGVKRTGAEFLDRFHIHELCKVGIVPSLDLLDLVRGAEAVKEVDERNSALDRRKVSNGTEVHDLLRVRLGEHRKAGLTACVNVRVIAEDVQRVRRDGTRRDMNDAGEKLARDLVKVRDHEKESLRRRVGRRESTGCERSVNGACRSRLGFHLNDLYLVAEDVYRGIAGIVLTDSRPCVDLLRHGRRRGDGIDGSYFREGIRHVCRGCIAVHGNLFAFDCHLIGNLLFM